MEQEEREKMAYVAGLIDGDGSLCVGKTYKKYFTPIIEVALSHKETVMFLFKEFDGRIGRSRKLHKWILSRKNECFSFLIKIKDFLIQKRELAIHLLNLDYEKSKEFNNTVIQEFNFVKPKFENEIEAYAYISGFMDADGHISIKKRFRDSAKKKRHYPDYYLDIGCGGTDFRNTDFVANFTKLGKLKIRPHKRCFNNKRLDFRISRQDEVKLFLENCLPHLRIKKEHAKIILHYIENYKAKIGGNDHSIPEEQLKHRENCYQKIKTLQIRGCDLIKPHLIDSEAPKQGNEAQAAKACSVND